MHLINSNKVKNSFSWMWRFIFMYNNKYSLVLAQTYPNARRILASPFESTWSWQLGHVGTGQSLSIQLRPPLWFLVQAAKVSCWQNDPGMRPDRHFLCETLTTYCPPAIPTGPCHCPLRASVALLQTLRSAASFIPTPVFQLRPNVSNGNPQTISL